MNGKLIRMLYTRDEKKTGEEWATLDYLFSHRLTWGHLPPINSCCPITKTTISIYSEKYPNQTNFFLNKRYFMQLLVNNRQRLEGKSQRLSKCFGAVFYLLLPFSCFCLTAIRSLSSLQQLHGCSTPKSQCWIRQLKAMPQLRHAELTSCKLFLQHWLANKN